MKQITTLQLFEGLTKSKIKTMAKNSVENIRENGKVLQVAEALSAMELFIKEVKAIDEFKSYVREEIEKHNVFKSESGAKIESIEVGVTYDYSNCNDDELDLIQMNFETISEALKGRKEFLKKVPVAGIDIFSKSSGEIIKIYPPSKSSTSTYKVTLSNA